MLLILIHHITTAPDIDTDTYLSSVGYACFEGLPEMIMNNPIRMGHGAIINGHGGPGWHGGQGCHVGPGELIVPEKYRFLLSTCITDSAVVEMGSCDVVGVKTPCMGDCRPASRRVMSDTSPTYRWSDSECCAATIPRSTPPCVLWSHPYRTPPQHHGRHLLPYLEAASIPFLFPWIVFCQQCPWHQYILDKWQETWRFGFWSALSSQKMPRFAMESLLRVEFSVRPIW